jgi:hypothetical protein
VLFPQPGTYLSGPINLAGRINLEVDGGATLRMLPRGSYPSSSTPFITASNLNNVEISGPGVIDGQGAGWWSHSSRPDLIQFSHSSVVAVENVTIVNSPKEHLKFSATNDVTVNGVTVSAPSNSPNTDGIDPAGSDYLIENCNVAVGDDNVAVKPQSVACGNITIANCTFGSGHGVSVGGETNDGLDGLTVTNCTFTGTTNGLRLKAGRGFGGLVQNVSYDQITMTNVQHPIWVTSYYLNGSATDPSDPSRDPGQPVTATTPFWQNLSYSNISATGASDAGTFYGLPEAPVVNVTLTNVNIAAGSRMKVYHAYNVQFIHSTINPQPLLTYDATVSSSAVAFLDAGFELPFVGIGTPDAFQYNPSGSPWTFTDLAGVAGNCSGLTAGNPNAPEGTQVAFLQDFGSVSQAVYFPAGTYALSLWAGQWAGNSSSQSVQVQVDGAAVSTFTPADTTYAPFTSDSFTLADGSHTVSFAGLDPDGQENIAFLDQVGVNLVGPGPPGAGPSAPGGAGPANPLVGAPWMALAGPAPSDSFSQPGLAVSPDPSLHGPLANLGTAPLPRGGRPVAVDAFFIPLRNGLPGEGAAGFPAHAGASPPVSAGWQALPWEELARDPLPTAFGRP